MRGIIFACRYSAISTVVLAVLLCGLMAVGCGGRAEISLISLNAQAIDPPRVEPSVFNADQCYWWVDEEGDLNLAMRSQWTTLILGRFVTNEFAMSLVLDKPPAGSGRDYRVGLRESRTILTSPLQTQRLFSTAGVICVLMDPGDATHGSFRIFMTPLQDQTAISILPYRPGPILCYGTFRATRDAERGMAIRHHCEEHGWLRPPRANPTTMPVHRRAEAAAPTASSL